MKYLKDTVPADSSMAMNVFVISSGVGWPSASSKLLHYGGNAIPYQDKFHVCENSFIVEHLW